jgi:hypothetical protein
MIRHFFMKVFMNASTDPQEHFVYPAAGRPTSFQCSERKAGLGS